MLLVIFSVACGLAQDHATELEAVRAYAMHRSKELPDYTCIESIQRSQGVTNEPFAPNQIDPSLIEAEVSIVNHEEIYQLKRVWGTPVEGRSAVKLRFPHGQFAGLLDHTFDPGSKTTFRWNGISTREGRELNEFSFAVSAAHGYGIVKDNQSTTVAYEGRIYADARSHEVLRIEIRCIGIPGRVDYRQIEIAVDYKPMDIAGKSYMLPSHHLMHARNRTMVYTDEADYEACRRFEPK